MQNAAPFQLRQVRDLGQTITATFTFLRAHWRPLFRTLAAVCVPLSLLSGFLIGSSFTALQRISMDPGNVGNVAGGGMMIGLGYLLLLVSFLLMAVVVHEYMRAYHLGEHESLGIGGLLSRSFRQLPTYFGILFFLGVILMLVMGVAYIPAIAGAMSGNVGTIVGMGFLSFLLLMMAACYISTIFSLSLPAHAIERTGAWRALGRSAHLVKGGFWPTLGLIIVITLVIYVIVMATMIVVYIAGAAIMLLSARNIFEPGADLSGMSSGLGLVMAVVITVMSCVSILTQPIMYICLCLKYFSRVEEKEATGLQERMTGFDQM